METTQEQDAQGVAEVTEDQHAATPIELTEREIAIAEGRDPDELPVSSEAEVAPEAVEPQEADPVLADPSTSPATPAAPWFDRRDVEYAQSYGVSEYDLSRFRDRGEFQNALWLAERNKPAVQEAPKADPPKAEYVDAPVVDGKVNVEFYVKHEYDDATIALAKTSRALQDRDSEYTNKFTQQEQYVQQIQAQAQEAERARQINAFHDAVDSHRADFFGKSVDEHGNDNYASLSPEQKDRRTKLFDEVAWMCERMAREQERAGQPIATPSWKYLIKKAEDYVFGSELRKLEQDKQRRDVQAQSKAIRPAAGSSGATHARSKPKPPVSNDPAEIAEDPDVIAAWDRMQQR